MFSCPRVLCRRVAVLLIPMHVCLALSPAYAQSANAPRATETRTVPGQPAPETTTGAAPISPLASSLFGPAPVLVKAPSAESNQANPATAPLPPAPRAQFHRGLIPLFASYGVLQALDVHSTLTAINNGGREQNPVVAPFASHPAAFVAFKAALTTATLYSAARLSRHNKVAAYAMMFGLNSAYLFIVAHNYHVASSLQATNASR